MLKDSTRKLVFFRFSALPYLAFGLYPCIAKQLLYLQACVSNADSKKEKHRISPCGPSSFVWGGLPWGHLPVFYHSTSLATRRGDCFCFPNSWFCNRERQEQEPWIFGLRLRVCNWWYAYLKFLKTMLKPTAPQPHQKLRPKYILTNNARGYQLPFIYLPYNFVFFNF